MAEVLCSVRPGLRSSERTVAVEDVHGRKHHLRVEAGYVLSVGDRQFLPIGVVGIDTAQQLALIELPHESDAGTSRLWVRRESLRETAEMAS